MKPNDPDRYTITAIGRCTCGMRRWEVVDHFEGTTNYAHHGLLDQHDASHQTIRGMLAAERREMTSGYNRSKGES